MALQSFEELRFLSLSLLCYHQCLLHPQAGSEEMAATPRPQPDTACPEEEGWALLPQIPSYLWGPRALICFHSCLIGQSYRSNLWQRGWDYAYTDEAFQGAGLKSVPFTRHSFGWERSKWRPEQNWDFVMKAELENACEALMKEMITVKMSSKRCIGMLHVDKGREERTAWVKAGSCDRVCLFQGNGKLSVSSPHTSPTFHEVIWGQKIAILLRMPGYFCRSSKTWWIYKLVFWTECPSLLTDSPNTDFKIKQGAKNIGYSQRRTKERQGTSGWSSRGSTDWCPSPLKREDLVSKLGEAGRIEALLLILVSPHEIWK